MAHRFSSKTATFRALPSAWALAWGTASSRAGRTARRTAKRLIARLGAVLRSERGFTLIELMIVIAIIGILTAILIPRVLAALAQSQINTALNELKTVQTGIEEYYDSTGSFPGSSTTCTTGTSVSPSSPSTCWVSLVHQLRPYLALSYNDQQLYNLTSVDTTTPATASYTWTYMGRTITLQETAPQPGLGTTYTPGTYTITVSAPSGVSGTSGTTVSGSW